MSHCHASRRNVAASPLNDDQSRAVGTLKLIAHWLLSSESVVCVRSYVVFPQDLRGRGPRHAFRDPAPPSKPSRPHGVSRLSTIAATCPPSREARRWKPRRWTNYRSSVLEPVLVGCHKSTRVTSLDWP
jgi:hypothetical protein